MNGTVALKTSKGATLVFPADSLIQRCNFESSIYLLRYICYIYSVSMHFFLSMSRFQNFRIMLILFEQLFVINAALEKKGNAFRKAAWLRSHPLMKLELPAETKALAV